MSDSTRNAEALRLHYLQAMGISVYYPRFQLEGARPSSACAWVEPEVAPAPPAASEPPRAGLAVAEPPPRREPPPARSLRDDPPAAPVPPRRPQAPARPAAAPAMGEALQFQLLFHPLDAELSLALQLPALARPQLADRQRLLLGNLLRWLGRPLPAGAPRIFRWPLPGLPVGNTPEEAGASLLVFLEQAALEQPFRQVMMLGEQGGECLRGKLGTLAHPPAWQLYATHGLDEMLALPALKRAAWQALLPLHASLHAARP